MWSKRWLWPVLAMVGLAAPGCGSKSKQSGDEKSAKAEETAKTVESAKPSGSGETGDASVASNGSQAPGRFVYSQLPATTPELKKYEVLFKPESRMDIVTKAMSNYALPKDIPVQARECKKVNAFYSSKNHNISLCYELADAFYKGFLKAGVPDQQASQLTVDAFTFTLLHEMGHALIAELDLGASGGEEDNADDLASLILIQAKHPEWAMSGPVALQLLSAKGDLPNYADEHSLTPQRIANVLCQIYGSDPDKHGKILEDHPELRSRAPKCPKEYRQRDKFWTESLAPHFRKPAE